MKLPSALFVLIIACWNIPQTTFAQHVTNPKASVLDVSARQAFLKANNCSPLAAAKASLKSCLQLAPVPAPAGPMNIPHRYFSGSHGPTNPAEAIACKVYDDFEERITAGMNQYVATGNHAEAECALDQLDMWAKANALTDYDPNTNDNTQSWYQAEWTLASAGITMSVLVNDPALDPAKLDRVKQWLKNAAHKLISFEKPGEPVGNNHYYFRALAAVSIGVVTSDDGLYQHGIKVYKAAIDQINPDGAFPLEMERHERATHYQGFAIEPLILIAEFAARQGDNLYSYSSPSGHTLQDAINFFGRALADPSVIKKYTPEEQVKVSPQDFAPYPFYAARFGDGQLPSAIMEKLKDPVMDTRIGGSTTILASKCN